MAEKEKKCIGIIFGGESNEHYISISSAKTVFKALISKTNKERFCVQAFYINKYGVWFDNDQSLEILKEIKSNDMTDKYQELPKVQINFLNNIESVLIEGLNPKNVSQMMGRTRTNRLTFIEIPKNVEFNYLFGDELNVKITEARSFSLSGQICK